MKVGILGGTFDPIHNGHIQLAESVIHHAKLDKVILVPNYKPPHKRTPIASASDRYEMCKIATYDSSGLIKTSSIDISRKGVSYAIDTIKELKNISDENDYYYIIGMDSAVELLTWKDAYELVKICKFIVVSRSNIKILSFNEKVLSKIDKEYHDNFTILDIPTSFISSTYVKKIIDCGGDYNSVLNRNVREFICSRGLYQ